MYYVTVWKEGKNYISSYYSLLPSDYSFGVLNGYALEWFQKKEAKLFHDVLS